MRKTFKHLAMAALASALIAGQATTAFAFKNDTNNGPGSGKSTEVSLQAPGDNSDSSQSSGKQLLPQLFHCTKSLPSQQTLPSLRPLRPRKLLQKQPQILLLQQKPLYRSTLLPRFRPTKLSYRYSFFVPLTRYGVIRSVMTLFFLWVMQDFLSMCIYANNLPGDVLYRTYSSSRGWTNWAMNGGHTDWSADCPVEAVQIRLNGIFGDRFDVYYRSNLSDGTECDWSQKRRHQRRYGLRPHYHRHALLHVGQRS